MKIKNLLFSWICISLIISCLNFKASPKVGNSLNKEISKTQYELGTDCFNFYLANDSICQTLNIRKISENKEYLIPEKLEFNLTLRDKRNIYKQKTFAGVAKLTSPNESFSSKSKIEELTYFAADYNFNTNKYKIKIRLDVENFEACVVSIDSNHLEELLEGFQFFLKKYPDYDVLKRGECK